MTDTDIPILQLTANGLSGDEVADQLKIDITVVKSRLRVLRYALYAENTAHLMAQAIRVGLIDPDNVKTLEEQGRNRKENR